MVNGGGFCTTDLGSDPVEQETRSGQLGRDTDPSAKTSFLEKGANRNLQAR
jgi:hypothetical protein